MSTSLVDADSLLVLDVGSVSTRAMLFDVVDGRYRFLASGTAKTTAGAPFHDVSEGVRRALDRLQEVTGRRLVDGDEQLVIPSLDGAGVDTCAVTFSAGPPLKVVAIGLLDDVSVESARRLASATYTGVLETIGLNDRRKPEDRIDLIARLQPDLIIAAGGTEGGASQSVMKLLEAVGLASYVLPEAKRPEVLFVGNQELQEEVQSTLGGLAPLHIAPNVRPTLEEERLDAVYPHLNAIYRSIRVREIPGVSDLDNWSGGGVLPASYAFSRMIAFLTQALRSKKGVLGLDVGASATTIAAAYQVDMALGVYPQLGLGAGVTGFLDLMPLSEITRWLTVDVPDSVVRDYIYKKSLYPDTVPATQEDLAIEEALARQAIRHAVRLARPGFPSGLPTSDAKLLPWFEPVIATGSVLTQAPNLAHAFLTLLDGLQPTGATTFLLDHNHLTAALGAAAAVNPILTVQVLDSNTSQYLGTVISLVGNARPGTPVLKLKMRHENGGETNLEVKQGALEVLPLPAGQTARLRLQPLHRYEAGMGAPGRGGDLRVHGGSIGVVIDARGRPLRLPEDAGRRRETLHKWLWTLGG